ncbi:hypothetical protein [Trinickia soli]|uniref:hypothetical protein n=1 Tax=Trinickia soli TaxID=380675 RepID=UPI0011AF86E7|nr:hypothetical protein [Trinickia soli]CAB3644057.1 hypothetical protein LMG24076_00452 [Trinickia soli]
MADTTNASLTPEAIRLECLRLVYRPDKDDQWIIDRAASFTRFVCGPALTAPPTAPVVDAKPEPTPEPPKQTDKPTAKARSKSS